MGKNYTQGHCLWFGAFCFYTQLFWMLVLGWGRVSQDCYLSFETLRGFEQISSMPLTF